MNINASVDLNSLQHNTNIVEVGDVNNNLENTINTYLKSIGTLKSKNTQINYRSWFKNFFFEIFKKEMEFVTWEDVNDKRYININSIKKYITYLAEEKNNSNVTINNKMSAIKTLFLELSKEDGSNINMKAFSIKRLSEKNNNSYGILNEEEINGLFTYCKEKETNGIIKYLFFKCLYITGYRFETARNLKWKNIKQKQDPISGVLVWVIDDNSNGSKNNFSKAISDNFYKELVRLKQDTEDYKNDYIFSVQRNIAISDNTIRDTFKRYCDVYKLDKEERNLVIHSIKKTSTTKAYKISNHDIKLTQYQANHSKASTTMDYYISNQIPYTSQISYIIDTEIDKSVLDNLNKKQLLELIKLNNDSMFLEIVKRAKEKGYVD